MRAIEARQATVESADLGYSSDRQDPHYLVYPSKCPTWRRFEVNFPLDYCKY